MRPISQEEYEQNLNEDLALLKDLSGLKITGNKRVNWSPFSRIKIGIGANSKRENISEFLASLPANFQFMFYDLHYEAPKQYQNGAYVHVKLMGEDYYHFAGHHEWNTPWQKIDPKELVEYIFRCRAFSREKFEVFHKRKVS